MRIWNKYEVEVWILIERHCNREVIFSCVYAVCKKYQNMVMNRPSTERILTSLASLESWHSQFSNDTKIITNRSILMHFMAMFWFWDIFGRFFSIKKRQRWSILVFFQHENDQNSKYVHEMHQYSSVDNNFGVVRQLRMPAFQRRQDRQNPSNRRSIHAHGLISKSTLLIRRCGQNGLTLDLSN